MEKTNLEQYAHLRTILDSLEIGALRYYLDSADPQVRQKHFDYLTKHLMPIIDKLWGTSSDKRKKGLEVDCPDGYHECNGCCVPYPCLGDLGLGY